MDIWALLGTGLAMGLAHPAQKYVMQPTVRGLKRLIPNCWLKTILFFEVGKKRQQLLLQVRHKSVPKALQPIRKRWRYRGT